MSWVVVGMHEAPLHAIWGRGSEGPVVEGGMKAKVLSVRKEVFCLNTSLHQLPHEHRDLQQLRVRGPATRVPHKSTDTCPWLPQVPVLRGHHCPCPPRGQAGPVQISGRHHTSTWDVGACLWCFSPSTLTLKLISARAWLDQVPGAFMKPPLLFTCPQAGGTYEATQALHLPHAGAQCPGPSER